MAENCLLPFKHKTEAEAKAYLKEHGLGSAGMFQMLEELNSEGDGYAVWLSTQHHLNVMKASSVYDKAFKRSFEKMLEALESDFPSELAEAFADYLTDKKADESVWEQSKWADELDKEDMQDMERFYKLVNLSTEKKRAITGYFENVRNDRTLSPIELERRGDMLYHLFRKEIETIQRKNPTWTFERAIRKAFGNGDIKESVFVKGIYKSIINKYNKTNEEIQEIIDTNELDYTVEEYKERLALLRDNYLILEDKLDKDGKVIGTQIVEDGMGELYYILLRNLSRMGITINTYRDLDNLQQQDFQHTDVEGESVGVLEEQFEQEDLRESWQVKSMRISPKEKLSPKLKEWLNSLPMGVSDDLGFEVYMTGDEVYNILQGKTSNSESTHEMVKTLETMQHRFPWVETILKDFDSHKGELLKTQLWVHVSQKVTPLFKLVVTSREGFLQIVNSSSVNLVTSILDDWTGSYHSNRNAMLNKDGSVNKEKAVEMEGKLDEMKIKFNNKNLAIEEVYEFFAEIGLHTDEQAIEALFTRQASFEELMGFSKAGKNIRAVLDYMKKGINPLEEGAESIGVLRHIARELATFYPDYYQSAHKNVSNEMVFGHIASSYMAKFLNQMKDKESREALIEDMKKDPFLEHSPFIEALENNPALAQKMQFVILEGIREKGRRQGKEYSDMSRGDLLKSMFAGFFNDNKWDGDRNQAYYLVPILADAGVATMVGWENYANTEEILDMLAGKDDMIEGFTPGVFHQEWARIKDVKTKVAENNIVKEANKNRPKNKQEKLPYPEIANKYSEKDGVVKGTQFHFFDYFNGDENLLMEDPKNPGEKIPNLSYVRTRIQQDLDAKVIALRAEANRLGIINDETGETFDPRLKNKTEAFLQSFVYNNVLAQTQLISLLPGDLAYYKNTEDFYKRVKEIWSPGEFLDTNAKWYNPITKQTEGIPETYNVAYAKDREVFARHAPKIYDALWKTGMNKDLAAKIASQYGYFQQDKDGNAIHTDEKGNPMTSIGKDKNGEHILIEPGKVSETDAQSIITMKRYKDIMIGRGRWNTDLEKAYQEVKQGKPSPKSVRVIFQTLKPFLFTKKNIESGERISIQHKNSEFVMLPIIAAQSEELSEMMAQMEKHDVDVLTFDSAIKVGKYDVIEPGENGRYTIDENTTIHTLSNKDYRIQMETPQHHIDTDNLLGTQLRKLIVGDLALLETYDVAGDLMTGNQLIETFDKILDRDVEEDMESVDYRFSSLRDFVLALKEEIIDKGYGNQYLRALEINPRNGRPMISLYNPLHATRNENMSNSIFKNSISKRRINGASLYNVSAYGFSDDLDIVFNPDGTIKYVEAMLPPWAEGLISVGEIIDPNDMPDKLDRGLVYRIPTEYKYSMFPIKVKKFLPREAGGGIIMPTEVTMIAGLDFDIDKVYGIFYNFVVNKTEDKVAETNFQNAEDTKYKREKFGESFDEERAKKEYANAQKGDFYYDSKNKMFRKKKHDISMIESGIDLPAERQEKLEKAERAWKSLDELEKTRKLTRTEGKEKKAAYNTIQEHKKYRQKMSDNYKLDMFLAIMSSRVAVSQFLRPGGFDSIKDVILGPDRKSGIRKKLNMFQELNPTDVLTTLEMFDRNMTGAKLIGIFANFNSTHALFQHSDLRLTTSLDNPDAEFDYGFIEFDGEKGYELNKVMAFDGVRTVTENIAEFLAAAVDNAKEPLASFGNINTYTANILGLILSTGYSIETAINFVSQPAIRALAEKVILYGGDYQAEKKAEREIMKEYEIDEKEAKRIRGLGKNMTTEQMGKEIGKDIDPSSTLQKKALFAFLAYKEQSKVLNDVIRATKISDSGPGPTIGDNIYKKNLLKKVLSTDTTQVIKGTHSFFIGDRDKNGKIIKRYDGTQYFRTMYKAIAKANDFLSARDKGDFPYLSPGFEEMRKRFESYKRGVNGLDLTVDEINRLNKSFMSFISSGYPLLKYSQSRGMQNSMVESFEAYRDANKNGPYAPLINRLKVKFRKDVPFRWLEFENAGLDNSHSDYIRGVWEKMLKSSDPKAAALAKNLAVYQFYMHGFQFTPKSFGHMVPVSWMAEFATENGLYYEDYIGGNLVTGAQGLRDRLEEMTHEFQADSPIYDRFFEQYIRNFFVREGFLPSPDIVQDSTGKIIKSDVFIEFDKNKNPISIAMSPDELETHDFRDSRIKDGVVPLEYVKMNIGKEMYILQFDSTKRTPTWKVIPRLGVHNIKQEWDIKSDFVKSVVPEGNYTHKEWTDFNGAPFYDEAYLDSLANRVPEAGDVELGSFPDVVPEGPEIGDTVPDTMPDMDEMDIQDFVLGEDAKQEKKKNDDESCPAPGGGDAPF